MCFRLIKLEARLLVPDVFIAKLKCQHTDGSEFKEESVFVRLTEDETERQTSSN